jgi:integrase/recombinase XerD
VRRDHISREGRDELHPEGVYFLQWWKDGTRTHEAVGADAFMAAEKAKHKQAEMDAVRNGLMPTPVSEAEPEKTTLKAAIESYTEYIRYHRSLRTFRTYRPILTSFKTFCSKTNVADVERQDLIDFATDCMKKGQKGKSIYNKLVVMSQVMKQHGKAKLLTTADWPSFVETVRPIYEDAELTKLFEACTSDEAPARKSSPRATVSRSLKRSASISARPATAVSHPAPAPCATRHILWAKSSKRTRAANSFFGLVQN